MIALQISFVSGQWVATVANTTPPVRWAFNGSSIAQQRSSIELMAGDMNVAPGGSRGAYDFMSDNMARYFQIGGSDSVTVYQELFETTTDLFFNGAAIYADIAGLDASMDLAGAALLAAL